MNPSGQDTDYDPKLTPEQGKKILESPPKGTLFIVLIFGLIFTVAWLILFFGRFAANGPVH
jgi:hypothetical protein